MYILFFIALEMFVDLSEMNFAVFYASISSNFYYSEWKSRCPSDRITKYSFKKVTMEWFE